MIGRLLFFAARLVAAGIFLMSWAYGVITQSSFAFEQMVKPKLFPFLADFVTWHHMWFGLAYLLSASTLVGEIRSPQTGRTARLAAIGYILAFGAVTAVLVSRPYLASLDGSRDLWVVPGALAPLLWLAAIDHLVFAPRASGSGAATDQRVVLRASIGAALLLWLAHAIRWLAVGRGDHTPMAVIGIWTLTIDLGAALLGYAALTFAAAIGARRARPGAWEHAVAVVFIAAVLAELVRRVILPTLAFTPLDSALIAAPFGVTAALMWSGLRLRTARHNGEGVFRLLAIDVRPVAALALMALTVAAGAIAFDRVEYFDWAGIPQQLVALVEAAIVFGLMLPIARRWTRATPWSMPLLIGPPALAVAMLHALAPANDFITARLTGHAVDPHSVADRSLAADPLARLAAAALVSREPFEVAFYQRVHAVETARWAVAPRVPPTPTPARAAGGTPPHVFILAIDSLRRDYVSLYNPAVRFTPQIERWSNEGHVFRQAFSQYGGTHLALPALWAGRAVPRGWATIFKELNVLEPFINANGYDFVINDFTFEQSLRPDTGRTFLTRYIPSVQTDFCRNVTSLEMHLRGRKSTKPLFVFLAPMNLHILNTRIGEGDETAYAGFHAPYARQVERVDACFGAFISLLKREGLYDNSVVVLTSDHGDSLGEDDRWGHQAFLFPEIVRIPLIVRLPAAYQTRVTTDLGRMTLLTDVAPTLLSLITGRTYDYGMAGGAPFYVPPGDPLRDRRREPALLMSSYGPTYGLLRRNGREMYVANLANLREYAFTLEAGTHRQVPPGDARRRVSQAELVAQIAALQRLYTRP